MPKRREFQWKKLSPVRWIVAKFGATSMHFRVIWLVILKFCDQHRGNISILGILAGISVAVIWAKGGDGSWEPLVVLLGLILQLVYFAPKFAENPFSDVQFSLRPALNSKSIGRDKELSWLLGADADALIVGQPGSGKTFLAGEIIQRKAARFVIRDAPEHYEEWYRRERKPKVLIVDDAGFNSPRLKSLLQFRQRINEDFQIIAVCWPGEADSVQALLGVPDQMCRSLAPLTPKQIVEVIQDAGLSGPDEVVGMVVDQSRGNPGLAATLVSLCLKGGVHDVWSGDALSREIESLNGDESAGVLGTFAVAGNAGLPVTTVAAHLQKTEEEVHRRTKRLAAAGVLVEMANGKLRVVPPPLQFALARNTYYSGATSINLGGLSRKIDPPSEMLLVAIEAKKREGTVTTTWLRSRLKSIGSSDCWHAYAWLGAAESSWILTQHPSQLMDITEPALHYVPMEIIPILLARAMDANEPSDPFTPKPMEIIKNWIRSGGHIPKQDHERRVVLQQALLRWIDQQSDAVQLAVEAIAIIVSPEFHYSSQSPDKESVSIRTGVVSHAALARIAELWPELRSWLSTQTITNWTPLFSLFHGWANPHFPVKVSQEFAAEMNRFAETLMGDIIVLAKGHPGVHRWALEESERFEINVALEIDPDFLLLTPLEDWSADIQTRDSEWDAGSKQLADTWSSLDHDFVLNKIADCERWRLEAGIGYPNLVGNVCFKLADAADDPARWVAGIMERSLTGFALQPFLRKLIAQKPTNWEPLAERCLKDEQYAGMAVGEMITVFPLPDDLWELILEQLPRFEQLARVEVSRNTIRMERVNELLGHPNRELATAIAVGIHDRRPKKEIPRRIKGMWEEAMLSYPPSRLSGYNDLLSYWVKKIFQQMPGIGYRWMERHIADIDQFFEKKDLEFVEEFNFDQRKTLLSLLSETNWSSTHMCRLLVGTDSSLFDVLLSDPSKRKLHLTPLDGEPKDNWAELAQVALRHGYSARDVVDRIFHGTRSWSGKESICWRGYLTNFESLICHHDSGLREVGQIGQQMLTELILNLEQKEQFEMYNA